MRSKTTIQITVLATTLLLLAGCKTPEASREDQAYQHWRGTSTPGPVADVSPPPVPTPRPAPVETVSPPPVPTPRPAPVETVSPPPAPTPRPAPVADVSPPPAPAPTPTPAEAEAEARSPRSTSNLGSEDPELHRWQEVGRSSLTLPLPIPKHPPVAEAYSPPKTTGEPPEPGPTLPTIPVRELIMTDEMDIGALLRALADAADLNILVGENVNGPLRISLRGETRWDRLFLAIIEAHGLHYDLDEDLLRVMARGDVERKIAMEKALREHKEAIEERVSLEPLTLEIFRVRYADVEKLAASVRAGMAGVPVSARSPTVISADSDSGLLIIQATPTNLARATRLAEALDQPAYQILIEASIVQANSETARDLGFRWGAFSTARDGQLEIGTTPRADGFNSNFPAAFDPSASGLVFGVLNRSGQDILQAQLSALERDGKLNIVSTPSITTLDKQLAIIESGEERPFQTASGAGVAAVPTIEFKRAVLRLEVTPQVIDETWVKLLIHTTKDEFDDSKAVIIDGTLQVPIITRTATTVLYLANGQTTVIGGLSTDSRTSGVSGIPILKDIPLLGALFRSTSRRAALGETLIFITPQVLPNSNTP